MKRHRDSMGGSHIAALFRQHEAKKIAPSMAHSPPPLVVDDEETGGGGLLLTLIDSTTPDQSDTESDIGSEDATTHSPSPQQPSPRSYDAHFLPYDPGERIPISLYNANDQDDVRRGYILKGPCQPIEHDFLTRKIKEIDYVGVLNKILPRDIRVIGWCPVAADFLARFSCLGREYKYLFWKGSLDITKMQNAASKFIGEHDFRNFCKMDAINCFESSSNDDELWAMTIKGSAFLWHQVRCMVAVLFLIGQGLESPFVVDSLLDITKTPRKPQYTMAPELPLILRSCLFDKVSFMCSSDTRQALIEHFKDEYHQYMLQAAIYYEALSCLSFPGPNPFESRHKKRNHIPLLSRQTERFRFIFCTLSPSSLVRLSPATLICLLPTCPTC